MDTAVRVARGRLGSWRVNLGRGGQAWLGSWRAGLGRRG